ncbi:MAG TPA: hypothetical protein VK619_07365 [Pyrinomonadaceae bacterium]|nr:hypothetical protein [Pyrinomonadaceae bacterium]
MEELEGLNEDELKEVAEYLAFLKFRSQQGARIVDESKLAALYAEFAEEDRSMAEEGLADYAEGLMKEDAG